MVTGAGIIALLTALKPILLPIITLLIGWVIPSPLQKAKKGQEEVSEAERKATDSRGDVADLDDLP